MTTQPRPDWGRAGTQPRGSAGPKPQPNRQPVTTRPQETRTMTPFATWLTAQLDAARARELAAADTYMQSKYQNPDIEARNLVHWAQAQARVTLLAEVQLRYLTTEALGIIETGEQEAERDIA